MKRSAEIAQKSAKMESRIARSIGRVFRKKIIRRTTWIDRNMRSSRTSFTKLISTLWNTSSEIEESTALMSKRFQRHSLPMRILHPAMQRSSTTAPHLEQHLFQFGSPACAMLCIANRRADILICDDPNVRRIGDDKKVAEALKRSALDVCSAQLSFTSSESLLCQVLALLTLSTRKGGMLIESSGSPCPSLQAAAVSRFSRAVHLVMPPGVARHGGDNFSWVETGCRRPFLHWGGGIRLIGRHLAATTFISLSIRSFSQPVFVEAPPQRGALFQQKILNQVPLAGYLSLHILRKLAKKMTHLSLMSLQRESKPSGVVRRASVPHGVQASTRWENFWFGLETSLHTKLDNDQTLALDFDPELDPYVDLKLPPCSWPNSPSHNGSIAPIITKTHLPCKQQRRKWRITVPERPQRQRVRNQAKNPPKQQQITSCGFRRHALSSGFRNCTILKISC